MCDFFVYIPQYGGGTASLNVTVAASIVLHHFGGMREIDACTWIVFQVLGLLDKSGFVQCKFMRFCYFLRTLFIYF